MLWFSLQCHLLHIVHYQSCWGQSQGPSNPYTLSPTPLHRPIKQTQNSEKQEKEIYSKKPHWEEEQIKKYNGPHPPRCLWRLDMKF